MKKGDFLIIAAVVLLVASSLVISLLPKGEGAEVVVTVAGEKVAKLSLDRDFEQEFVTEHGKNTLVIKDGYADIIAADCYGNDCVHQRKISKNGEVIVCLPHKLVVEITSPAESENDF